MISGAFFCFGQIDRTFFKKTDFHSREEKLLDGKTKVLRRFFGENAKKPSGITVAKMFHGFHEKIDKLPNY